MSTMFTDRDRFYFGTANDILVIERCNTAYLLRYPRYQAHLNPKRIPHAVTRELSWLLKKTIS